MKKQIGQKDVKGFCTFDSSLKAREMSTRTRLRPQTTIHKPGFLKTIIVEVMR